MDSSSTGLADLRRRLEAMRSPEVLATIRDVVGAAWATAAEAEAPVKTGALKRSIRFTDGALVVRGYGLYVERGTARRVVPASSRLSRAGTMHLQVREHVNRGRAPNPFLERAWRSPAVQTALHSFGSVTFQRQMPP